MHAKEDLARKAPRLGQRRQGLVAALAATLVHAYHLASAARAQEVENRTFVPTPRCRVVVDDAHGAPRVFGVGLLGAGRRSRVLGKDDVGAKGGGVRGFGCGVGFDVFVEAVEAGAGDGEDGAFVGEQDGWSGRGGIGWEGTWHAVGFCGGRSDLGCLEVRFEMPF